MSKPGARSSSPRQHGFVSILVVLAIVMVVAVILKQSVQISATKASTGLQQSDSVAALSQAQNGTEVAIQKLSSAFKASGDLSSACVNANLGLTTENTALNGGSGPASFALVNALASVNGYCKIRVKGTVRSASRTIETWIKASVTYGTVGFGTNPKLTLTNPWNDVPAIGMFNTGWGVQSSDGQTVTGNADCTDCKTGNKLWYTTLTGAGNDIGGAGNYSASIAASASAPYEHTLDKARNYAMVGHVLGGTSGPPTSAPTIRGSLSTSNNNNDRGVVTSATVKADTNWCATDITANAMIIGVSAKGPGITSGQPNLSGKFTSAKFTFSSDTTGPGIAVSATAAPSKTHVHYPDVNVNDGLSTPIAWGDVFVELYYFYKDKVDITVSSSTGTQLTVSQTYATDSLKGRYLQPGTLTGSNQIYDATYITGNTGTTVTLNQAPKNNISSTVNICTGICGFFPSSNNTNMTFSFGKASGTVSKAWVGGIACIKGVDDSKVKPVTNTSGITVLQWHEVLSTDSALF